MKNYAKKYRYGLALHNTYIFKIGNEYAQIVACTLEEARKRCEALSLNNLRRREMKLDPSKHKKLIDITFISVCASADGKDCDCSKYKNTYGSDFQDCAPKHADSSGKVYNARKVKALNEKRKSNGKE